MIIRASMALSLAASLAWLSGCGGDPPSNGDLALRDATVVADLAAPDLARPADLAGRDLVMPDAATVDLRVVDLPVAPPPDLAELPDLATPDLTIPDLAMPDLTAPDLAMVPDLRLPADLVKLPDFTIPPDLYGIDFSTPDLAEPPDLVIPPDLAMPVGMVTGSLSGVTLGQNCMPLVPPDPVTFSAMLKITNVGNIDVGPVTAMSGEITQNLVVVATFTIVPTFTGVIKPGASATLAITKLNNSVMPAKMCQTLTCNAGYNVAIYYMGPAVPLGNRAVSGLTFASCVF